MKDILLSYIRSCEAEFPLKVLVNNMAYFAFELEVNILLYNEYMDCFRWQNEPIKLILRPLSDWETKYLNDPMLPKGYSLKEDLILNGFIGTDFKLTHDNVQTLPIEAVDIILQLQFDTDNLLTKGQAIDYNVALQKYNLYPYMLSDFHVLSADEKLRTIEFYEEKKRA